MQEPNSGMIGPHEGADKDSATDSDDDIGEAHPGQIELRTTAIKTEISDKQDRRQSDTAIKVSSRVHCKQNTPDRSNRRITRIQYAIGYWDRDGRSQGHQRVRVIASDDGALTNQHRIGRRMRATYNISRYSSNERANRPEEPDLQGRPGVDFQHVHVADNRPRASALGKKETAARTWW